jgi:transcriptional regulator with XRE-family HTH domain
MSAAGTARPPAIARVLRKWRRRRKLTQKELAAKTGLPPVTISAFELGESAPRAAERKRLCAALEVELRDFDAEAAWIEGEEKREIPGHAPPGELTIEELSAAWDELKPLVMKFFEWVLRKEEAATSREGHKP